MSAEIVRTATMDGLMLEGAFTPSVGQKLLPLDACLFLHGSGSNFHARGILEHISEAAAADGLATLRVDTRGHDIVVKLPGRRNAGYGGSAFERIGECVYDVTAWLDWLSSRGFARVAIIGHSLGAVKGVYAQVHRPHLAVRALLALSPPRFHHATFQEHPGTGAFRADYQRAEMLVGGGSGDTLMEVSQPIATITSAASFVEKYGPDDRYDFVPLLPRLNCPTLVLIGELSEQSSAAFETTLAAIAETNLVGQVTAERVPGADTSYRGQTEAPWSRFRNWLRSLAPRAAG